MHGRVIYLERAGVSRTLGRARYKFALCLYCDCYYFLIKRYCAAVTAAVLARANDVERRVNETVRAFLLLRLRSLPPSFLPAAVS